MSAAADTKDEQADRRHAVLITHREAIRRTAARHKANAKALVESVARGEDTDGSDCDFLARFAPGASLLDLAGLKLDPKGLLRSTCAQPLALPESSGCRYGRIAVPPTCGRDRLRPRASSLLRSCP